MWDIRRLLASETGFFPHTQAQALKALDEGILGPEHYIHMAVDQRPILEEPWDQWEIDRLLAKRDLDDETREALMAVLSTMTKGADKELALFAAESIDGLERSLMERARAFLAEWDSTRHPADLFGAVAAYRSMASMNFLRPAIAAFYGRQALALLEASGGALGSGPEMLALRVELLLDSGDLARAARELSGARRLYPDDGRLGWLAARAAFSARRYRDVAEELGCLGASGDMEMAEGIAFWTGGSCRER